MKNSKKRGITMWCPKCKNEYVPGITQCADCGVSLVESLEAYDDTDNADISDNPFSQIDVDSPNAISDETESAAAAPVTPAHAYVSGKSKTEDMKSTAYTFTFMGILGLVLLVLFATGFLPLHTAGYMKVMICLVMGAMFVIFLLIGLRSFSQIKAYSTAADDEEHLLAEIKEWFLASFDKEFIDNGLDTNQPEETLYFVRYEVMNRCILEKYPDVEESLLDHIIETLYTEIF